MILTKFGEDPIRNLEGVAFTRIDVRTDVRTEKMTTIIYDRLQRRITSPWGPVALYWLRWPNSFAITLNHNWIERGFKRHFHHSWSYRGGQFYWAMESGVPWELALATMFIQLEPKVFCEGPPTHHSCKVWLNSIQYLQRIRFCENRPI